MKLRTILELQADYGWTIPLRSRDAWRPLYPSHGFLKGFAAHSEDVFWLNAHDEVCWFTEFGDTLLRVQILATDGVLALFSRDYCESVFTGHLANFIGAVAREEVHENDWNYERNVRVVKVFRRKDGSCAIIPQDTFKNEYFERHTRLDAIERQVYEGIGHGAIAPQDFEATVAQLREAKAAADAAKKKPSRDSGRTKRILAMI